MKLIQLNIWGGKLGYQILDFLNAEKPDIVCMQEVNDLPGTAGAFFATLEEIQEACGFQHRFMSPTYSSRFMERTATFGNAILSNLPFAKTETIFTNGTYKDNFDMVTDDYNIRNLQHGVVESKGKPLHVFNHHGYLILGNNKQGSPETVRQMKLIADTIEPFQDEPVILVGDFNLAPESESIQLLNRSLRNLPIEHQLTCTYSQLSNQTKVCDYVFVNDKVAVTNFVMAEDLVSDHKALILEFQD